MGYSCVHLHAVHLFRGRVRPLSVGALSSTFRMERIVLHTRALIPSTSRRGLESPRPRPFPRAEDSREAASIRHARLHLALSFLDSAGCNLAYVAAAVRLFEDASYRKLVSRFVLDLSDGAGTALPGCHISVHFSARSGIPPSRPRPFPRAEDSREGSQQSSHKAPSRPHSSDDGVATLNSCASCRPPFRGRESRSSRSCSCPRPFGRSSDQSA